MQKDASRPIRKPTEEDVVWATKRGLKIAGIYLSLPTLAPFWAGKLLVRQARKQRRRFDPNTGRYTTESMWRYWFRHYIWK